MKIMRAKNMNIPVIGIVIGSIVYSSAMHIPHSQEQPVEPVSQPVVSKTEELEPPKERPSKIVLEEKKEPVAEQQPVVQDKSKTTAVAAPKPKKAKTQKVSKEKTPRQAVDEFFAMYAKSNGQKATEECAIEYLTLNPDKIPEASSMLREFRFRAANMPVTMMTVYGVDCAKHVKNYY